MGGCRGPVKYGSVQEVDGGLRVHDLEDLAEQGAQLFCGDLPTEDNAEASWAASGRSTPQMQNKHLHRGPDASHCPMAPQGHQPTPRKLAGPASASAAGPPPPLPFQPAPFPHSCPSHGKGAGREQHPCQVTRTALLTPHKCFTRVPLTQRPIWGGSAPGTRDSVCRSFQWGQASEAAP